MTFTYEIYVFERSRWVLESSFSADRRRDALDLARRIEAHQSANGVQVIRERVDPETGYVERTTVYNTWRKRRQRLGEQPEGKSPGPMRRFSRLRRWKTTFYPSRSIPRQRLYLGQRRLWDAWSRNSLRLSWQAWVWRRS